MFYILICLFIVLNIVQCNECPAGTVIIQQCPNGSNTSSLSIFNYIIKSDDRDLEGWMVCPRVDSTFSEWHISLVVDNGDVAITNGTYCANTQYDTQQMCSDTNGLLQINHTNLPNDTGGVLQVLFTSSVLKTNITIRSSSIGVFPLDGNHIVTANEGTLQILKFIVFYPSPTSITVLYNGEEYTVDLGTDSRCVATTSMEKTKIQLIQFNTLEGTNGGVYTVRVNGTEGVYESNITLIVNSSSTSTMMSPSITPTPSLSTSIINITSSSSITSSNTSINISSPTTSASSSDNVLNIVWVFVAVGVFFVIVIMLILFVVICLCWFSYKKKHTVTQSSGLAVDESVTEKPRVDKPRMNSTSSERPLAAGGSLSSVNSSTNESPLSDYTAVYCSPEYIQCGTILKDKHGELIQIIDNWEEVRLSIIQPNCNDILIFTVPTDEVFKEIMSCGIDPLRPTKRDKLRIITFTGDHFFNNTIGINGYKVVQVDGPPNIDNLLTAINKAEFPELTKPSPRQQRSTRGHDETDDDREERRRTNELLLQLLHTNKQNAAIQSETLETQKETLEVTRETAGTLEQAVISTTI